jgi:hypothetical protein
MQMVTPATTGVRLKLFVLPISVAIAISATAGVAFSGPVPHGGLWDTTRVLKHTNRECNGAPKCSVLRSPKTRIAAGKSATIILECPDNAPNLWGWDSEQHEHIGADLTADTGKRIRISAQNMSDAPGAITVFVGCSKAKYKGTAFPEGRHGLPSQRLAGSIPGKGEVAQ